MATSTAAASRSPQARSFQMKTMAMQRARPTMISPVRYSGRSARKIQASDEHERGGEHPVDHQRGDHELAVADDASGLVVADLRQHRVHHHQQAQGDGQGDAGDLDGIQRLAESRNESPESEPEGHGRQDPDGQVAVQGG